MEREMGTNVDVAKCEICEFFAAGGLVSRGSRVTYDFQSHSHSLSKSCECGRVAVKQEASTIASASIYRCDFEGFWRLAQQNWRFMRGFGKRILWNCRRAQHAIVAGRWGGGRNGGGLCGGGVGG